MNGFENGAAVGTRNETLSGTCRAEKYVGVFACGNRRTKCNLNRIQNMNEV
jgi:hypothetical protein